METDSKPKIQIPSNMKRSPSSNSDSYSHFESPHSFVSPVNSPGTYPQVENSIAIVAVDKFTQCSPQPSPLSQENAAYPQAKAQPQTQNPAMMFNRREEGPPVVGKVKPDGRSAVVGSWRSRREDMMKVTELGFRISEVVLCLISFSVMTADKTQGWSGDSYDRYGEYRYCLSVNVIAFVYSGFQAYDLVHYLVVGKHVIRQHVRLHFNFFMDQILAYLLISASSSAATRVNAWQSKWGKDEFTEMASASVTMAFVAFIAFAISSLISGYNLCNNGSI